MPDRGIKMKGVVRVEGSDGVRGLGFFFDVCSSGVRKRSCDFPISERNAATLLAGTSMRALLAPIDLCNTTGTSKVCDAPKPWQQYLKGWKQVQS